MPRLLLAVYLLTGLMGHGAFVLCAEGESAPALEFLLQACCEDNDDSGRAEASTAPGSVILTEDSCPCVDLPADFLLLHRLDLGAAGKDLPALLPCTVPATVLAMPEASRTENQLSFEADRGRPDLPGAGAAPRVLRT